MQRIIALLIVTVILSPVTGFSQTRKRTTTAPAAQRAAKLPRPNAQEPRALPIRSRS